MPKPLIQKLKNFTALSDEDKRKLTDATREVREFGPRQDIIREGERPEDVHLLLEGWAGRYKVLRNGQRPIMAYLIPGDLCDIHITLLDQMDHSIGTLSSCKVAFIPRDKMDALLNEAGPLSRALWWSTLVDEAILRQWLVNIGHRSADQRVSHFICEMLLRARAVGLTNDDGFEMPLTQEELADTMGMTPVHMNRMLKDLTARGFITRKGKRMNVDAPDGLMAFAEFDPLYLHHQKREAIAA